MTRGRGEERAAVHPDQLLSAYDYPLPAGVIAQRPAGERRASRLLTLDRRTGATGLGGFAGFPELLRPGDCLVLNDARVVPARLHGTKEGGSAKIEVLLLGPATEGQWEALCRPGKRLRAGTRIVFAEAAGAACRVVAKGAEGVCRLAFETDEVYALLDRLGAVPLPPYIEREADASDRDRYQTVYARAPGAVAAPTAGLHFDEAMLAALRARVDLTVCSLTLHVGMGTFRPVSVERVTEHRMHAERFTLPLETAVAIEHTRATGGRVVAVGTTVVRVLESCWDASTGRLRTGEGETNAFFYPPYEPRVVDALLTNFHLPKSTLLMLVSCFCGRENLLAAYREALAAGFRFFSYGDCMFVA